MIVDKLVRRAQTFDPNRIPRNGEIGGSYSGVRVTDLTALQQATVWACVYLLSDIVSNLPLGVFEKTPTGRREVDPEPALTTNPTPSMDIAEWLALEMVSLLLRGNGYGLIADRDRLQYPTQIIPLHPDEVSVRRDSQKKVAYYVSGERVPTSDVMHIKGLTWPGMLEGLNPIQHARQMVGLALAAEEFGGRFFSESANPSGVLQTDQDLSENVAKVLLNTWEQDHTARSRRPAVLAGGLKWQPISLSPEESQFLQTRSYSRGDIAGFFRVPPHLIGDHEKNSTWGSGMEEIGLQFVTYTLQPWLGKFERQLSSYLPDSRYVKFNVAGLLRGRTLERYQAYVMARNAGWMNVDEIRALEERAPVPDGKGQDFIQPMNMGPLGFDPTKKGQSDGPDE